MPFHNLRSTIRQLSSDISEQRRLGATIILLFRSRIQFLRIFGRFLSFLPSNHSPKLFLWFWLSRIFLNRDFVALDHSIELSQILPLIRATQSYKNACKSLKLDRNGFHQRGLNYRELSAELLTCKSHRLLIFHHFDTLGYLPTSWLQALLDLQSSGWQVVISTSYIQDDLINIIIDNGILLAYRENIGHCLGAYRDISLLLHFSPPLLSHFTSLVCINDSNILIQPASVLLDYLNQITSSDEYNPCPILSGFTDSVQLNSYHIQSFFLYANQALLHSSSWLRFWTQFSITASKEDLICSGEIGLSQYLLNNGVSLKPLFPLVQGLLEHPYMSDELLGYGIHHPYDVNQTLFAWKSLLDRGYPFIKKHVLFNLLENQGHRLTIAELADFIPDDRFNIIEKDIHQLLLSRYSVSNSTYPNL